MADMGFSRSILHHCFQSIAQIYVPHLFLISRKAKGQAPTQTVCAAKKSVKPSGSSIWWRHRAFIAFTCEF